MIIKIKLQEILMDKIINLDKEVFLFLNGLHSSFFDSAMSLMTETYFWLPLYLFLIFIIIQKYKKDSVWILVGVMVTIVLCDQITTGFMKPFFARLRPSHEPGLEGLVHIVNNYRGGLYGFASSHAANTFGVAMFLWLILKSNWRWIGFIFIWAAVMSYTRIYLGVHYPGDILVGALVGIGCGWIAYRISNYLMSKNKKAPTVS